MATSAASANKTYVKEALRLMMLGEGWKVTLEYIVARIGLLDDHYIFRATGAVVGEELYRMMGERAGLVQLVRELYRLADTACPFDTQRQALLSSIHLDVPQPAPTVEAMPENAPTPRPRRYSGSIA